jgi:2-polyprenyl-6-methoxyphenol hydroxylase-like FAD-dependent oxidoreductase
MGTNVLIAGAGPVGLTLAAELARYGVAVRIVDKAKERTGISRSVVVWSRTLELLDRAGCGAALVAAGTQVSAAAITTAARTIDRIELGKVTTPHPYALMLLQCETERLLEEHLNQLGVKVERGVEIAAFAEASGRVASTLRKADGSEERVSSHWLVGCDGARSVVRHGLRMVFTGGTLPNDWLVADVRLHGVRAPQEIEVSLHADGVLARFPINREFHRLIANVGLSVTVEDRPSPTLSEVQALLDKRGSGGVAAYDPQWLGAFSVDDRKVVNYRAGRMFLAGDAAHVQSPVGGQGMNTGMQDAFNLAWKLALVCRGTCAEEALLESYSIERSPVGDLVLKNSSGVASLGVPRGQAKNALRSQIASLLFGVEPALLATTKTIGEDAVEYPESPLNAGGPGVDDGPAEGERAPIRAGEASFGAGDRPRFALCADASNEAGRHGAEVLLGIYNDFLEEEVRAPFAAGGLWLVRPDGYVALAGGSEDWDKVAAYLDQIHRGRRLLTRAALIPAWMRPKAKI